MFGKPTVHTVTRRLGGAGVKLIVVFIKYIQHVRFHSLLSNCYDMRYETRMVRYIDCVLNVMAHAQKPDFVFR